MKKKPEKAFAVSVLAFVGSGMFLVWNDYKIATSTNNYTVREYLKSRLRLK